MKKYLLFSLTMFMLFSCKKKLTQFYIDYNSTVVISSSVGQLVPFSVNTPSMTTDSEQKFEVNNTSKDRIRSIFLNDLVLTITSPSNEDFSFLSDLEIFISSPLHNEQRVAFKTSISNNVGTQLICDLGDIDLQNYIKDESFTLRLRTTTDETVPQDVDIDVYTRFFVDAKVFK